MFSFLSLDGPLMLAALAVAFVLGVLVSQKVKDFLSGVPSELRAVLKSTEAAALNAVAAAKAKAVADVAKATSAMPAVVKPTAAPTAAPVAAAPADPAKTA